MAFLRKIVFQIFESINYYYRTLSVFQHPGKSVIKQSEKLSFTNEELTFLTLSAQTFNFEPDYSFGLRQKELSVTKLQAAELLGNSGALVLDKKLVVESVFGMRRLALSPAWRMPAFMLPKFKKGNYSAIFHFPWAETSNYHWFLDCLPRLYLLGKYVKEPVTLAVSPNMPQFQFDTLNFVLKAFPNIDVAYIRKNEKWHCENFLLPSFVVNIGGGYIPADIGDFLRSAIVNGYRIEEKQATRKIYISRSRATKRRIKNEAELLPILEKYGFEVVYPELMSYREQVAMFYESMVIAGAHGAGFTNTFFAQKATVLELHPANAIKAHYFLLSKSREFDYHYLVGSEADGKMDFEIPLDQFELKLQSIAVNIQR